MPKRKTHEKFIEEIKEKFNDEYTVLNKYTTASAKVEVKHKVCEKEYSVRASALLSGARCSHCFKQEKKTTDQFKQEIKSLTGNEYSLIGEYNGNKNKVKLIHNVCKGEYEVTPGHFLSTGRRCPYCNGGSPQARNTFVKKFNNISNGEYELLTDYIGSKKHISVRHIRCNTTYKVRADNFLSGKGCPNCNQSRGEKKISIILESENIDFIPQKRFNDCRNNKTLPFDFAIIRDGKILCLIEYNGLQHYKPVDFFNGEEGFKRQVKNDKIKHEYCVNNNIDIFYITYKDKIEDKMNEIIYKLSQS